MKYKVKSALIDIDLFLDAGFSVSNWVILLKDMLCVSFYLSPIKFVHTSYRYFIVHKITKKKHTNFCTV